MATTFWLVRHGETEWSRSGRHTGRTDIDLTEHGRRQAAAVGALLAEMVPHPALVLTSPARRALETCELAGLAGQAVVDPDLWEWDYGSYEGLTTSQIRTERPGWSLWVDGVPGGESASDVARRADRVIDRVRAVDGDVVAFAHGHLLRVLAARWVGLPPAGGRVLALAPASVSILGWEREVPIVGGWNRPCGL